MHFSNAAIYPVYVEVKNGKVVDYTKFSPDFKYTKEPTIVNNALNEKKLKTTYIPYDSNKVQPKVRLKNENLNITESLYVITVEISGKIGYYYGGSLLGIPDVIVKLDWDSDDNPSTGYAPYPNMEEEHVNYAKTDKNGNYYFSFNIIDSPCLANGHSDVIRVYTSHANSATFNGVLGVGSIFPNYCYIDISSATNNVFSSNANIEDINPYYGGALRYLYRARKFSIDELNYTPSRVRYYIDTNQEKSFFGKPGAELNGETINVSFIVFNSVPTVFTGYHEYGHFVEWDKVGVQVYDNISFDHDFELVTTDNIAWTEGWAEFYHAATLMYWYKKELPSYPEFYSPSKYQWLDYSQSLLTPNVNNAHVEGAIACFLYSLWDKIGTRAPNYRGDNDDISFSGEFILDKIGDRMSLSMQLYGSSNIDAYKNVLLVSLGDQDDASVIALYNEIILQNGKAKPATCHMLNVTGNFAYRNLSWNDNTCPDIYYWHGAIDLVENNEQGYKIYS